MIIVWLLLMAGWLLSGLGLTFLAIKEATNNGIALNLLVDAIILHWLVTFIIMVFGMDFPGS